MGIFDRFYSMLGYPSTDASVPKGPIAVPAEYPSRMLQGVDKAQAQAPDEDDSDEDFDDDIPDSTSQAVAEAKANGQISSAPLGGGKATLASTENTPVALDSQPVLPSKELATAGNASPSLTPTPSPSGSPAISDYIKKLMGNTISDSDMAQAQESTRNTLMGAGIGKAANNLGAALSYGKANNEVYNDIEKNADAPVKNLLTKQSLATDKLKQAEMASKLATDQDKADPNSDTSKYSRAFLKNLLAKANMSLDIPESMSAAVIEKQFPGIEAMLNKQTAQAYAQGKTADKSAQHLSDQELKTALATRDKLTGTRAPGDIQLARKNQLLSQNALEMIAPYTDLNKLQGPLLESLKGEVMKMATGGAPGHAELMASMPVTTNKAISDAMSRFTSTPTSANAGEFVKLYMQYVGGLKSVADKRVHQYNSNILESSKKDLSPEHYDAYNKQFVQPLSNTINSTTRQRDPNIEGAISSFMKANPQYKDRVEALRVLKENKRLPDDYS